MLCRLRCASSRSMRWMPARQRLTADHSRRLTLANHGPTAHVISHAQIVDWWLMREPTTEYWSVLSGGRKVPRHGKDSAPLQRDDPIGEEPQRPPLPSGRRRAVGERDDARVLRDIDLRRPA